MWLLILVIVLLAIAIGFFLGHYQLLSPVVIAPSIVGPLNGFCVEVTGSYHSIGGKISSTEKTIQSSAPEVWKLVQYCMGVYYDNPQKVAAADCRSRVCFVTSVPNATLEAMEEYKTLIKTLNGYSFSLPSTPSLTWHYPYKNFLSFMIGAYKYYSTLHKNHPDLEKKAADAGLQGAIELYRLDANPQYILFAVPTVIDRTHAEKVPLFRAYEIKKSQ